MPWYEQLAYKDFDNMVITEIVNKWNWTREKAENYYFNDLHKKSCFNYGVTAIGIDNEGNEYTSTRLAILRILSKLGLTISDQI
jgi:hypothetical protein